MSALSFQTGGRQTFPASPSGTASGLEEEEEEEEDEALITLPM